MPSSQQPQEGRDAILSAIHPDARVLDVGAGSGKWGKLLHRKVIAVVGLEVWKPSITKHNLHDVYDKVIHSDIRVFDDYQDYDVVILGDVLEHMPRADAVDLTEKLAALDVLVFLTVPISPCPQDGAVYGNPYETHVDQWTDEELQRHGWILLHEGLNEAGTVTVGTYELGGAA